MLEMLGLGRVYAITCLKAVILICEILCSWLVQEPRCQVIPGLRYKAMCEMWSIAIATCVTQKVANGTLENVHFRSY